MADLLGNNGKDRRKEGVKEGRREGKKTSHKQVAKSSCVTPECCVTLYRRIKGLYFG